MFTLLFTFLPKIMLFHIKFVKKKDFICVVSNSPLPMCPVLSRKGVYHCILFIMNNHKKEQLFPTKYSLPSTRIAICLSINRHSYSSVPLERRFCGITVNDFGIFDRIDDAELSMAESAAKVLLLLLFNCSAHCHMVVGVVVT